MKRKLLRQLGCYLDGELSPVGRREIEALLRSSPDAARELGDLEALRALARDHRAEAGDAYFAQLPGLVRRRLVEARVSRAAKTPSAWFRRPPVWGWAAAAALLLAVVTPLTLRQGSAPEAPSRSAADAPAAALQPSRPKAAPLPQAATLSPPSQAGFDRTPERRAEAAPRLAEDTALKKAAPEPLASTEAGRGMPRPAAAAPASFRQKEALSAASPLSPAVAGDRVATGPTKAVAAETPSTAVADAGVSGQVAGDVAAGLAADEQRADGGPNTPATTRGTQLGFARGGARVDAEAAYESLLARGATTTDAAQSLRDEWQRFAERFPASPHADEALVRSVEAGALLWRLSRGDADRAWVERMGRAYLKRHSPSAPQKERVTRALAGLDD